MSKASKHFAKLGTQLDKQKFIVQRFLASWVPILGLDHWHIDILYHSEPPENWSKGQVGGCCVQWKYKEVTLGFLLTSLSDATEKRLEYIVVHELCHTVVNQMRGTMNWDHNDMANEERVVTEMAYAFIRARHWVKGRGGR